MLGDMIANAFRRPISPSVPYTHQSSSTQMGLLPHPLTAAVSLVQAHLDHVSRGLPTPAQDSGG